MGKPQEKGQLHAELEDTLTTYGHNVKLTTCTWGCPSVIYCPAEAKTLKPVGASGSEVGNLNLDKMTKSAALFKSTDTALSVRKREYSCQETLRKDTGTSRYTDNLIKSK